ncbi:phage major tail tube protein [Tissierella sp. MSJ-40]|uniref:Phage major tail tube protein n=1 Tax=Tissierella simiarum TaxID=2841534 RepID=A0ABS6E5T0_9FIRM|nr:phage major tail tube protein [Tissierella simiarum]MBU5438290.1 phage major tail tube protein [Tissierella simiarum]
MPKINESIINFAVYENSTEYYGMAEVTLPEISSLTEEVKGAGISGTFESVILGHLEAMTLTLNFRTLVKDAVALLEPRDHQIDLRVAQQGKDTVSGQTTVTSVKHVMVVKPKKLNPGKVAPASPAEASMEFSATYWATFIDGKKTLEIDILNFIYFVNGKDYLADVRKALGK